MNGALQSWSYLAENVSLKILLLHSTLFRCFCHYTHYSRLTKEKHSNHFSLFNFRLTREKYEQRGSNSKKFKALECFVCLTGWTYNFIVYSWFYKNLILHVAGLACTLLCANKFSRREQNQNLQRDQRRFKRATEISNPVKDVNRWESLKNKLNNRVST